MSAAALRNPVAGPWRAVYVLAITQVLAWGTIYYPVVVTAPRIAADRGWSLAFTMAGFSTGLLAAGLASRQVGAWIDRYGGHCVMPVGSLLGAIGLIGLVYATTPPLYFATWILLGVAMAASLYDPAFATLGRIFGSDARAPITMLTLLAGFTSTVSWPATHALIGVMGWRGTYLAYAAVLAVVAAPLHYWALPRSRAALLNDPTRPEHAAGSSLLPSKGSAFVLVAAAFAATAFIFSGLAAHLIPIFGRLGLEINTAVALSALFGPSQVSARFVGLLIARHVHPLQIVRCVLGMFILMCVLIAMIGISIPMAAAFVIVFGINSGLMTVMKGTLPLALFGPIGFGHLLGRIAGPALATQAVAPLAVAIAAERVSDPAALALIAAFAVVALVCFLFVRRPNAVAHIV